VADSREPLDAVHSRRVQLPRPKNSAGRNLSAAIAVGVALAALVLVATYVGPVMWYPVVCAAAALGMWEVLTRLRENGYGVYRFVVIVLGLCMIISTWQFSYPGLLATFTISSLTIMFARLFFHGRHTPPRNYLRDTAVSIFILVWIGLFGSFAAMISRLETGHVTGSYFIVTFILCVVASDVGGYVIGVLFGSHPMAPAVSPNKSWEGFAGSLVAGIITGVLVVALLIHGPWWMGIVLGVALVICATMGDLVESQFKRELGIKDMSHLLPGHGGIMDRLDGMLPAAAATYILLTTISLMNGA